jgi:hypothetical protein
MWFGYHPDVVERIPEVAAAVVWGPDGEGGLEALAHEGVPHGVVQRGAALDQPLLSDAFSGGGALTYRAEERFSEYLGGLPGLRGSTVIALPLRVADETHGVLVASGDDLDESDTDWVGAGLERYSVGLAVAAHIELLRQRHALDLAASDEDR